MLDSTTPAARKILTHRRPTPPVPFATLVEAAARSEKIGAGRILGDILKLTFRRHGLTAREYFEHRVYRRDLSMAEKREFIGEKENFRLNCELSPPGLTQLRGFVGDKLAQGALWHQLGLPATETQALFSRDRWVGQIPVLRNATEIADFLAGDARAPLFGKPVHGSHALGSVRIERIESAAGQALLGDGLVVAIRDLADEIVTEFPEGYLFQSTVEQHPDLVATVGKVLATIRLVTVIEGERPRVLYGVWKIPSPEAVSDNFWQEGSILARIDGDSGTVTECVTGKGPERGVVDTHPVTGKRLAGFALPFWREANDLVEKAHAIFPVTGCFGWDVGITPDGPILVECNSNPCHEFYQMATGRGTLNPEMQAVFDRVRARSRDLLADRKAQNERLYG
jgi:hypothetical protein